MGGAAVTIATAAEGRPEEPRRSIPAAILHRGIDRLGSSGRPSAAVAIVTAAPPIPRPQPKLPSFTSSLPIFQLR